MLNQINQLASDANKQLPLMVNLLNARQLTVKTIIENANTLKINAETLNDLGVKIFNGADGIESNKQSAREIFELAASKGSLWAKYNLASSLLLGNTNEKARALLLFSEMFPKRSELNGREYIIAYHAGIYFFNQSQYRQAWNCLCLVPKEIIVKEKKQANPDYILAQNKLSEIKQLAVQTLKGLFYQEQASEKKNSSTASPSEAVTELTEIMAELNHEEKSEQPSLWYTLSDSLEMYDPYEDKNTIAIFTKAKLEVELAESAFTTTKAAWEKTKIDKEPNFIIEAYAEIKNHKGQLYKEAEANFAKAQEKYQFLMGAADKKYLRRLVQTEKHFFAIERNSHKNVEMVAKNLLQQRQRGKEDKSFPLEAQAIPIRHLITAELGVIRASLKVMGMPQGYDSHSFPWTHAKTKSYQSYYRICYQFYGNPEHIQLGTSLIEYVHRLDPHENHVGDFYMENLGEYSQIHSKLESLVTTEENLDIAKERQLAGLMLRYTKTGEPITFTEMKQLNPNVDEYKVESIAKIFYHCFVKEPSSWMIPRDNNHELPLATMQLRAVRLIAAGYLHISDVFGPDSLYGVFTGKNIGGDINKLEEKITRINKLYLEMLILNKYDNRAKHYSFMREHARAVPIVTRTDLHLELIEDFGGDGDSDGEGYDSDTAEKLYPGAYKF